MPRRASTLIESRIVIAILALSVALLIPSRAVADLLYGITGGAGAPGGSYLYTVDTSSGNATKGAEITLGGNGVSLSSLAWDPATGVLYGGTNQASSSVLVTIVPQTGIATEVGQFFSTNGAAMTALAFTSNGGTLYGYAKTQPMEGLSTILGSGAANIVGYNNLNSSGDGMAINQSGTIYFAGAGASGTLYTLSPSTGLPTAGPTLSNAPLSDSQIKSMSYSADGSTLYGLDLQMGTFDVDLVSISTGSGQITNIGATQNSLIAVALPEPGSLALLGLSGAGGFLCSVVSRKRSKVYKRIGATA